MCEPVLATELWLQIFSYLEYKDVVSVSAVNHKFHDICQHRSIWKKFCAKYWLETKCPPEVRWREFFITIYMKFGIYIDCYATLKQASNDLLQFSDTHSLNLSACINSEEITEEELDDIEINIGHKLPHDYRCLYRIHNGSANIVNTYLFGTVSVYDIHRKLTLLNIRNIMPFFQNLARTSACIPLVFCRRSRYMEFIPLEAKGEFQKHHVYVVPYDSFRAGYGYCSSYLKSKSVTEWFTSYVKQLKEGSFAIANNCILRFYHEPGCVETTNQIDVSAATVFMPELSSISKRHFVHSYRITLSMRETASEFDSCQLQTRHWIITDELEREERVDGEGVIGEFPILRPGVNYSWTSLTTFRTTYGNMKGHFQMRNLLSGKCFDLKCPVFHMKCLPYFETSNIEVSS